MRGPDWFVERDLVLSLDHGHLRALRTWASDSQTRHRAWLLRVFAPASRWSLTTTTAPVEPVVWLHGDLRSGNVVWTWTGAVLVDPAAGTGPACTRCPRCSCARN